MPRRWDREKLVDLLLNDSGEAQLELMRWSATTSSHEVTNLLMTVLHRHAYPGKVHTILQYVTAAVSALFFLAIVLYMTDTISLWIFLPCAPFLYILMESHRQRQITERAALMLARLNDERAIPYLADSWRESRADTATGESITEELTRLATRSYRPGEAARGAESLRNFVRRCFPLPRKRDLTDGETDMFLSVLRLLGQSGNPLDQQALERISRLSQERPNHGLVIEAARQIFEPATTALPEPSVLLPAPTTSALQRLQQNRHS